MAIYPFERRAKILKKLSRKGRININQDSISLGVSKSTLHRDLEELEKQGLVRKVTGGAILPESTPFDTHFDQRMQSRIEAKEEIAKKAAATISDDTSIFMDHSTTTVFLAREIKHYQFKNLIILTNSLAIPFELEGKKGIQVISTGGIVETEFKALSGTWVIESRRRLNLHQLFFSVGAISPEMGLMTQMPFIQSLFPDLCLGGGEVIILADSSKFLKIATFQLAALGPEFTIMTDRELSDEIRAAVESKGARVTV
jgi:DeoR family fructose operon transcriptional repressor